MEINVLGSSSAGNCYVLTADSGQRLIIECGIKFDTVKKKLEYDIKSIAGILLTHSHGDHAKGIKDAVNNGIRVFCSKVTAEEVGINAHHRFNEVNEQELFSVGEFEIYPFDLKHDVKCFGYLIHHAESGTICFITDTYYVPYKFHNLNHIIIEANYCNEIVNNKMMKEKKFLRDRILQSHMELQTTKDFLLSNDLSEVSNIILIHLSDSNSDEARFKSELETLTQKQVTIATRGLKMSINKNPF